jgi:hypothetical protein
MGAFIGFLLLAAFLSAGWADDARAEKKTVCTITVNSPDEKEAFQRGLPADRFRFVELVERGRSDWLASACRQGIRCDVLVISGHYDGGNEFFSDRTEAREYLPVDEMERAACSASCPGLFSQLEEVYLFGCNTLNPEPQKSASGEIERSLARSGHSRADAERAARALGARHGESSRDRMQQIFMHVPVVYGFSSVAPVGPVAGSFLNRWLQSGGSADVGSGRASGRLLGQFTGHSLTVTSGLTDADPRALHRRDVCQFADDRLSAPQKLAFIHRLLGREMAEVRMFLDRLERYVGSIDAEARQSPAVSRALDEIADDGAARVRYLDFARDADQPAIRARMLALAQALGWLTSAEKQSELMRMIDEQVARNSVGAADVDLVCALNEDGALDTELPGLHVTPAQSAKVANAAVLACLGSRDARAQVLRALASADERDVEIARVYLRHRPVTDVDEQRAITADIARMTNPNAQARALDALARLGLSDRESLEKLTRLYPVAESASVQTAIAGVLIRASGDVIANPELAQTLRERRIRTAANGGDLIDVLIRRLELR